MMVHFKGYGKWGDRTGLYGGLIKVSGVFELQYDERVSIELTGKTYTDTLGPCNTHEYGAVPWMGEEPEESDRDFFKIFRIDGEGGEFLEKVLFTQQDVIDPIKKKNKPIEALGKIIPMNEPKNGDDIFKAMQYHINVFETDKNRTPLFNELWAILLEADLSQWDVIIEKGDRRKIKQRYDRYYKPENQ